MVAGIGLAATFGAGVTAQLGAMRIAEEIDALEAMAIRSVEFLVSARIVAGMIAITPLYAVAVILSFVASRTVTVILLGQSPGLYGHYFRTFLNPIDLLWSFLQAILMALAVLMVHTYYGYYATGGPSGVGVAVGNAVRTSLVVVVSVTLLVSLAVYGTKGNFHLSGRGEPMRPGIVPALAGLATYVAIAAIVALAVGLFRGSFTPTAPVTVLSPRAGLVMNNDARVKMRGVEVGKVASIEALPDGQAALHLAMDPSRLHLIPANVLVEIASTTVFGAKYVQLMPPAEPSPQPMHAGQVLDAQHVTVEINTVFQQLTAVLSKIEPAKLNETLGAIAKALNGRGQQARPARS